MKLILTIFVLNWYFSKIQFFKDFFETIFRFQNIFFPKFFLLKKRFCYKHAKSTCRPVLQIKKIFWNRNFLFHWNSHQHHRICTFLCFLESFENFSKNLISLEFQKLKINKSHWIFFSEFSTVNFFVLSFTSGLIEQPKENF